MLEATVELIGKKKADEYLKHNTANARNIDQKKLKVYVNQMKAGVWEENGEAIQFGEDGTLKNGQHRLTAISIADVMLHMVVVRGVKNNVNIYDDGKVRTIVDTARLNGMQISTQKGAAIAIIMKGIDSTEKAAKAEQLKFYEENRPDVFDNIEKICGRGILRKAGCMAALYCAHIKDDVNYETIRTFAKVVNSGIIEEGVKNNNTPLTLRRMLDGNVFRTKKGGLLANGRIQKPHFITTYKAVMDFARGIDRQRVYKYDDFTEDVIVETKKLLVRKSMKIGA